MEDELRYHDRDNNTNNGSMTMGEVVPLQGVDFALVITRPGVQECNLRHQPPLPYTQDRPCVVSNYIRPEVSLFKRNTANLEEETSKKNPLVQGVHYRAEGLQMHLRWRVRNQER